MRQSLTTAESDTRRLRRKNVKALQLGLEASEHLAWEKEKAMAKAACHAKEQARAISRLSSYISSASQSVTTRTGGVADPPVADE